MALLSNSWNTFEAIGNREDLADVIYRVAVTDTPCISGFGREDATSTAHEWQTQALAAASTANAQVEGDDSWAADAATATVRLKNYCQISRKTAAVTNTQQAVDSAGRASEMAYQEMLKGLELKRDIETIITSNQAYSAGATGTARRTASILAYIKTNGVVSGSSGGANPSSADGGNTRTDGTTAAYTEANLKSCLKKIYDQGGQADTVMLGSFLKQTMSAFTGRATQYEMASTRTIVSAVDTYVSDFGSIKVVPNRLMRQRDVLVLDMEMWAIAYLKGRRMVSIPLAITGDNQRRAIVSEYAVVSRNEKASGGVFDCASA